MNPKTTVVALILIAGLHGHANQYGQVAISAPRLSALDMTHINYLKDINVIHFKDQKAILDIAKLENLLKFHENQGRFEEAQSIRSAVVPYGCT